MVSIDIKIKTCAHYKSKNKMHYIYYVMQLLELSRWQWIFVGSTQQYEFLGLMKNLHDYVDVKINIY